MAWYNLTAVNASGVLPLMQSVRDLYFNPLGDGILLMIFCISFISANHYNNNPKLNLMYASFGVAIFSLFLSIFQMVSDFTPYLCWGLFAITIAIVTINK